MRLVKIGHVYFDPDAVVGAKRVEVNTPNPKVYIYLSGGQSLELEGDPRKEAIQFLESMARPPSAPAPPAVSPPDVPG